MIYVVTKEQRLFDSDFKIIGIDECLSLLNQMSIIQFDTETTGRDVHICKLLSLQFGNDAMDCRIVVDALTIEVLLFKDILESKYLIGQNLKFDLQFLYQYGIHPTKVYDTMIVEQFLYLGYPSGLCISKERYDKYQYTFPYHLNYPKDFPLPHCTLSYALDAIAKKRLGVNISKEIRGQIIYRGLDDDVIKYAANDIVYLEKIMKSQLEDVKKIPNAINGAKLECDFVPCIAYLEWCGIKLDENKWRVKMDKDLANYKEAKKKLDDFLVKTPSLKAFWHINLQGDLFEGFSDKPIIDINWSSSEQVIKVAKILGFNTTAKNKLTGEDTDSVIEKQLISQKGINDEFLDLYFKHQEYKKVVTSFGQGHIDAINPITGRIHTVFRQLGCASGRMSCGSSQSNTDLAKYKHLVPSACKYPNIQQLPADKDTRSSFVPNKDNVLIDSDFSALESRLGADIYQEKSMLDEFLHGSGDMHSLCAKMVFHEELKDIDVKDIKKKRPDLRSKVKPIEFSQQFGGSEYAIQGSLGCTLQEALVFKTAYDNGFKGITQFKLKGSKFVRENGYVEMNKATGHRMYWWDWKEWKERQQSFTPEFWDNYKAYHKGTKDDVEQLVKYHFKAASKWDRMALNGPTQGCGCNIIKRASIDFYNYILTNNLFGKVLLCALVHDEMLVECPKDISDTIAKTIEKIMLYAASVYCKSLPIPAEAEVGDHWIH